MPESTDAYTHPSATTVTALTHDRRYDSQALPGTDACTRHIVLLRNVLRDISEWNGQSVMLATEQIVAFTEGQLLTWVGDRKLHCLNWRAGTHYTGGC